jgi:hypothetical protein
VNAAAADAERAGRRIGQPPAPAVVDDDRQTVLGGIVVCIDVEAARTARGSEVSMLRRVGSASLTASVRSTLPTSDSVKCACSHESKSDRACPAEWASAARWPRRNRVGPSSGSLGEAEPTMAFMGSANVPTLPGFHAVGAHHDSTARLHWQRKPMVDGRNVVSSAISDAVACLLLLKISAPTELAGDGMRWPVGSCGAETAVRQARSARPPQII